MSIIRTVLGDIEPDELGFCHPHEHLLAMPPEPYATEESDLVLDSEDAARSDLSEFYRVGGRALVEMTPIDYHRNPAGLKRLSQASGVHIICVTGFLKEKFAAPFVANETVESLAERFIREIEIGIEDTGVRAGVIKAASSLNKITPNEEKVFRAAAIAHHKTGALISTHTEMGTIALEQVELLLKEGVHPSRILIGHLDRNLDWELHVALARTGVYFGFDQISKTKYFPDEARVDFIVRLVAEGFGQQIMLSSDLARKSNYPGYGGKPGLMYLIEHFVPMLRDAGLNETIIMDMLIRNPARALTLHGA
ncbi:MAG: phosphotriesterase-related protein [Chitinophagaceae bacterium]|nr:phosphotriesterase-related protein [Anaerolineae bacterium]